MSSNHYDYAAGYFSLSSDISNSSSDDAEIDEDKLRIKAYIFYYSYT